MKEIFHEADVIDLLIFASKNFPFWTTLVQYWSKMK